MRVKMIFLFVFFTIGSSYTYAGVCYLSGGGFLQDAIKVGDSYVPRDAQLGSVIGVMRLAYRHVFPQVICEANSTWETSFTTTPVIGIAMPRGQSHSNGPIYKTSIPGVGIVIETESFGSAWVKDKNYPFVPYVLSTAGGSRWSGGFGVFITLVKIGEIPMGTARFDSSTLLRATSNNYDSRINYSLSGSVTRSECSVPASAKSIEVRMGRVTRDSFKGQGSFLGSMDFSIPLTDCNAGKYPAGQGWNYFESSNVNLLLEGAKGSRILDANKGILGLTTSSSSSGVAVQVLLQDGVTPLTLGVANKIQKVIDGSMLINLKARYVQTTDNSNGPTPGVANAAASFTINYR